MIKNKKGSLLRAIFAIIGSICFLTGLFFLNEDSFLNAAIFGIAGILIIAISALPFIKSSPK